ncbi:CAF1 family ribonuclease [Aspergillus mulundensis]|uniref:Uncharacterized protein n=1 Tax=Aspergillus mulundensis TaxID=1810919 RepID=A0A3D8RYQ0_9EURO|nr:hypothetical protein DSM5745_06017 [Aspergillus mulundensis]RDW79165.1 hypothetical protein DSM5745_06017 [Aspergillus mulundensis]
MDVTARTFPYHLARILQDLESSVFVSIDLEFSGIHIPSNGRAGPQSLQQRYEDLKESAEKYQVLQVGLTFGIEDAEAGQRTCKYSRPFTAENLLAKYTLKPYNLYLSPIIDRRLDIERAWMFQSSAVEFLLENKFSMDSLFKGVTYVSREEEAKAISKAEERRKATPIQTSLDVKETDYDSLAFLDLVRKLIDDWLALGDKRNDYLNIPPPSRQSEAQTFKPMPSVLNRHQKRLVHQLVEVEYPGFVTIGRPEWVQIVEYNESRETAVGEKRIEWITDRARKETGFRWIAEALVGGDLTHLSPGYFHGVRGNNTAPTEQYETIEEFVDEFKKRLKAHRFILVGHNLFTDLIYFFRCFFGPLPDRMEDFKSMVHEHFEVVDTKYLFTHDCGDINPISSLQEINDSLLKISKPKMSIHPHFARYEVQRIDHEAGYDSLLTAQIFLKLSARLGGDEVVPGGSSMDTSSATTQNRFSNRFSQLQVGKSIDGLADESEGSEGVLGDHSRANKIRQAAKGNLIPRPYSQFWSVYGNKLRVFGTKERVCDVGEGVK